MGVQNLELVKIDPTRLIAAQHTIAVDLAENYSRGCAIETDWLETTLPISSKKPEVSVTMTRRNLDTSIVIDLPHAEFIFGMQPSGGFGPKEFMGHATVVPLGNRLLLGKGYYRLYARFAIARMTPSNRSVLVALDSNNPPPLRQEPPVSILGTHPALFGDFFTESLILRVKLRKKRFPRSR